MSAKATNETIVPEGIIPALLEFLELLQIRSSGDNRIAQSIIFLVWMLLEGPGNKWIP